VAGRVSDLLRFEKKTTKRTGIAYGRRQPGLEHCRRRKRPRLGRQVLDSITELVGWTLDQALLASGRMKLMTPFT